MKKIATSVAVLGSMILGASTTIASRTFDEAIEQIYEEKPYLRPRADHTRTKRHPVYQELEKDVHDDPIITWERLEHLVDSIALLYALWREYGLYQEIYGTSMTSPEHSSLLQKTLMYVVPPWMKSTSAHGKFGVKSALLLTEISLYRTCARYALMGIRYGVVTPLVWMVRGVRTLCLC